LNKKRPTQKKVASYDTKLIAIIAIAVIVVIGVIVGILVTNSILNMYVCKVNGKGIRDYEYEYFLEVVVNDMETEAKEALEDSTKFDSTAFWTAEKQTEAKQKALDDTVDWFSRYLLAVDKGYALTSTEKSNVASNVEYQIYYYYQLYTAYGLSVDYSTVMSYLGISDLEQYEEIMYKYATIEKYKAALEDSYKVEDLYFTDDKDVKTEGEEAIYAKYNSDVNTYRRVKMTSLLVAKESLPTAPTAVENPGDAPEAEETSEEYLAWKTNKESYDKYLEELETYNKNLDDANTANADILAKVQAMFDAFKAGNKYTGSGVAKLDTENKDEDGNTIKEIKQYEEATIETIAETEGESYSDTKGVYSFTGDYTTLSNILSKFALSIDWTDDTRTAVASKLVEAEAEEEEESEESEEKTEKVDYTISALGEYKFFEDDDYYYITRLDNILDINTSREEEVESDDEEDTTETEISVRATVINDLEDAKAEDEIDAGVKANASKFEVKNKKNDVISKILTDLLSAE